MKAIIEGKKYNTETAEALGEGGSRPGISRGDFQWYEETLYRTKKGSFFLAGRGGAMTHYSRAIGGGSSGGSGIQPLSVDGAREWAEHHLDTDEYEEIFGATEEA